jgi:hypothetical protein
VWFDGLNRFYVATEHHDALAGHFQKPPNVFDDFVQVTDKHWDQQILAARREAAEAAVRMAAAEACAARLVEVLITRRQPV